MEKPIMNSSITIRRYKPEDARATKALFFDTVRNVNVKHYSQEQVEAWASEEVSDTAWQNLMESLMPFIAEIKGEIVGYADLQKNGLIDHFFVHQNYQGMGIAKKLMQAILSKGHTEKIAKLHAHVSITAKPFFEHNEFNVVVEQKVTIRGQQLSNFVMERYI